MLLTSNLFSCSKDCQHPNQIIDEMIPPSCTTTGLTGGTHCEVCGKIIASQNTIEATEHQFDYEHCEYV